MENKYTRDFIDRTLLPIETAPSPIKNSAEADAAYRRNPYGYFETQKKHSSFQSWYSDLETIYSLVKGCSELPEFSTMVTIIYYDKDGQENGANHTSFDDRIESFKKAIDNGDFANADLILTVFKDPEALVESFLKNSPSL